MILGVSNPTIQIIHRRVRRERVTVNLLPARVMEPRRPKVLFLVGGGGVAGPAFTSQGGDTSFPWSTRHDEEEGDGDEDKSKEVSGKGDFERRHAEDPSFVSLVLSNHVAPR